MAIITATATYPDNKQIDLRDTFCNAFGYQSTITDSNGNVIANPQTKAQFIQEIVNNHFKTWLRNVYVTQKERELTIANTAANSIDIS